MGLLGLAVRRLVAQRSLTALMVVAFGFAAGALVSGPVYAAGAEQAVVYGYLQRASPLARDEIVTMLSPPGFDAERASRDLRAALSPLPISAVPFQEETNPVRVNADGATGLAPLAYRDGVLAQVGVVQGHRPVADDEVLLPEATAAQLLIGPGARLRLTSSSPTVVRVAGIYSSSGGGDPLVFGPGRLISPPGGAAAAPLPLLTTQAGFASISNGFGQTTGLHVEWDAKTDLRGVTVSDLRTVAAEATREAPAIRAAVGGASVTADLGSLIPGAEHAVSDSMAPIYLVALEMATVGLCVLLGVASLKLARQSFELAVLKTRGARTRLLLTVGTVETAAAAALGFPVALAVGLGLGLMARAAHGPGSPGAPFEIALDRDAVLLGVAGLAIGAAAVVLISVPQVRRSAMQERREASRERRPAWLRLPSEVVPLALGTLAMTELRRRGIQAQEGRLDPLVLVAPTLMILGGGILLVRALFWGFHRLEATADRLGSPSSYLAVHHLPRASANMSLALLLVLSAGLLSFSSSARTTVLTGNETVAREQVGADWNLLVGTPTQGAEAVGALASGTTLVFHGSVATSSRPELAEGTMIGLDPSGYAQGGWWPEQDAGRPLPTLLSGLTPAPIGVALPPGTTSVTAQTGAEVPAGVSIVAALEYPSGRIAGQVLAPDAPGGDAYTGAAAGARRLLSLVLESGGNPAPGSVSGGMDVTFLRVLAGGPFPDRTLSLATWRGLDTGGQTVSTSPIGDGIRARFASVAAGPFGGIAPPDGQIPALVSIPGGSAGFAGADVRVGSLPLPLHVVGTVHGFPGIRRDTPLIVVSIRSVAERFGQIQRLPNGGAFSALAMGARDPSASVRREGLQVLGVTRASTIEELLGASPQNLALGMEFAAGVAGAALAALALGLAMYLGGRRRRYELSSLRALGGRPGQAALVLALEYGLLLVPALAAGCGIGIGLLALVLSYVVPSVVGAVPRLLVDWNAVIAAIVVSAVVLGTAMVVTAGVMQRGSAASILRGEPE